MKRFITLLFLLIVICSCVKLPIQSIALTDAIIEEGKRMHELNVILLNKMFDEKREDIDEFIRKEYTPKYLEDFQKLIPEDVDFEEEFPNIVQSIIPQINSKRDMMQSALESQRIKLVTKLDSDYKVFEEASIELRKLIESGVKVNEARKKAFEQISDLTQRKIDLNQVETEIDKFIIKSGDISEKINELNSTINSLLNN